MPSKLLKDYWKNH